MTCRLRWLAAAVLAVEACDPAATEAHRATTSGVIAIENLGHQLAQAVEPASRIALLLAKSRFLGDYGALEEAAALAESLPVNGDNLLLRARARSAVHRFDDAFADLQGARRMGADARQVEAQAAIVSIATGHAAEVLPRLEAEVAHRRGLAAHGALANAYAELGRYAEADREYVAAIEDLRSTSPFPYAWIHFARGLMWSEQAGDENRGEAEYAQALRYLPEFAAANVHKAELEMGRGELDSALIRLQPVAENEPEALALLGEIRSRIGDRRGAGDIAAAARRYAILLKRQPLAFADHAAEFYLGPGADPERAWQWARRNLENRATPRAFAIAIRAAAASGRDICGLMARMKSAFDGARLPTAARREWTRRATAGMPDRRRRSCGADAAPLAT